MLNRKPYVRLVALLRCTKLTDVPVSLYSIVLLYIENIKKDDIFGRASGVAFDFTLAIFPAIIFLFTLVPFVSGFIAISNLDWQMQIMGFMHDVMPSSMYDAAASTIVDIISKQRGGLLTFGFLFAFFMATFGILSLMQAFNRCYRTVERRGFLKTRLIASGLTIMLAFVLLVAVLFLVVGQLVLDHFQEIGILNDNFLLFTLIVLRFLVVFLIFYLAISFIYYFAPAVTDRWQFFSTGSLMASLLSLSISFAFSFYITNFATYNKIYGSIGALMGLMIWLYLLSVVVLLGFELNATIDKAKRNYLRAILNKG